MPRKYTPSSIIETEITDGQVVDFDPMFFDEVVAGKGVMLEHWASMKCPIGMVSKTDSTRRPHPDHSGCSNGFLYKHQGTLQGLFSGVGKEYRSMDLGLLDPSTAQITVPRTYTNGEPVLIGPMDRLFLAEANINVIQWELVEANAIGTDRLLFPATSILDVVDSRGISYTPGFDFQIEAGQIKWIPGRKSPGQDPSTNKGRVFSVRYTYRPFWYVSKMLHEVRVFQTLDNDGNRVTTRGPQNFVAQREYMYQNEDPDSQGDSARKLPRPADGSVGSR